MVKVLYIIISYAISLIANSEYRVMWHYYVTCAMAWGLCCALEGKCGNNRQFEKNNRKNNNYRLLT